MPDEWVLLSEIEHWVYCPRQWAIIHLEQYFSDNDDTVRGHLAHERVDTAGAETRQGETTLWAADVSSETLRISGRCDRVLVDGGRFIPVEHKSGRRKHDAAVVQLVAQAMCLEEMTGTTVDEGRLYLVASNSTEIVDVASSDLRRQVCDAADQIRAARKRLAILPEPANDVRCPACSLNEACLPSLVGSPHRQRGLHGATAWP